MAAWRAQDGARFNSHWCHWADIEAKTERTKARALEASRTEFRAFVAAVPRAERTKFLTHLRPTIEKAPSFFDWNFQQHIDRDGVIIRVSRELLEEADALLVELQN